MRDQRFIIKGETQVVKISQNQEMPIANLGEVKKIKYLQIPRKPAWNNKSIEEQKLEQNQAFLDWKKQLLVLQENFPNLILTPYEKNFEVWKQLWYVVEKSDLLIQIIDCRDPLFYRSADLENYVFEQSKKNFLIINKADLVPESIRRCISEHLKANSRSHLFFSAKLEQEIIESEETEKTEDEKQKQKAEKTLEYFKERLNTEKMFGKDDLLSFFEFFAKYKKSINLANLEISLDKTEEQKDESDTKSTIIGMVGYPNVGKSSVINALCGRKKVGVDAKPGKTKNLQTILLNKIITLCDCPGLIFPSLASSKAEMICNGVISTETAMEYIEPINYILQTVPNLLLKYLYKLPLEQANDIADKFTFQYRSQFAAIDFNQVLEDQNFEVPQPTIFKDEHGMTARTFLQIFSATRGYHVASSLPDEGKAARIFIKDYITGKIPHFKIPEQNEFIKELEFEKLVAELKESYKNPVIVKCGKTDDLLIGQHEALQNMMQRDLEDYADIDGDERRRKIEFLRNLTEDDIVSLVSGVEIQGIKLEKLERRELKFLIKGDPKMETVIGLLKSFLFKEKSEHGKKNTKSFK